MRGRCSGMAGSVLSATRHGRTPARSAGARTSPRRRFGLASTPPVLSITTSRGGGRASRQRTTFTLGNAFLKFLDPGVRDLGAKGQVVGQAFQPDCQAG